MTEGESTAFVTDAQEHFVPMSRMHDQTGLDFQENQMVGRAPALRLAKRRRLVSPRRGFYVIVPLEHRAVGVPPVDLWLTELLRFHGARMLVQEGSDVQVLVTVDRRLRPMQVAGLSLRFVTRKPGVSISVQFAPGGWQAPVIPWSPKRWARWAPDPHCTGFPRPCTSRITPPSLPPLVWTPAATIPVSRNTSRNAPESPVCWNPRRPFTRNQPSPT